MTTSSCIAILGAGSWGSALAVSSCHAGHQVRLWARNSAIVDEISTLRRNTAYLPGYTLPDSIDVTDDLSACLQGVDCVLLTTPAQTTRQMAALLSQTEEFSKSCPLILCAKGLDQQSGELLSDVVTTFLPGQPLGILSGPSFADDVASGLPTAVTLAAPTLRQAEKWCELLQSPHLRPYASDDRRGVQLGGALKNVLAIACGIVCGKKLGNSAHAALMTRAFGEMQRLAPFFEARADTLTGLSGLGDLILTCSSPQSRNFQLGLALGEGRERPEKLAEGAFTATIAAKLAQQHDVHAPILMMVDRVLQQTIDCDRAIRELMQRPLTREKTLQPVP
jgi:glycerol-3-phosphate dehydrogenase (NAD(P)+)